jgi:hypothetical protein
MFPQGNRSAASPRVTTAPRLATAASTPKPVAVHESARARNARNANDATIAPR